MANAQVSIKFLEELVHDGTLIPFTETARKNLIKRGRGNKHFDSANTTLYQPVISKLGVSNIVYMY